MLHMCDVIVLALMNDTVLSTATTEGLYSTEMWTDAMANTCMVLAI